MSFIKSRLISYLWIVLSVVILGSCTEPKEYQTRPLAVPVDTGLSAFPIYDDFNSEQMQCSCEVLSGELQDDQALIRFGVTEAQGKNSCIQTCWNHYGYRSASQVDRERKNFKLLTHQAMAAFRPDDYKQDRCLQLRMRSLQVDPLKGQLSPISTKSMFFYLASMAEQSVCEGLTQLSQDFRQSHPLSDFSLIDGRCLARLEGRRVWSSARQLWIEKSYGYESERLTIDEYTLDENFNELEHLSEIVELFNGPQASFFRLFEIAQIGVNQVEFFVNIEDIEKYADLLPFKQGLARDQNLDCQK
jgi:hypothetical protein